MGGGEGTSDLESFFQTTVIAAVGPNTGWTGGYTGYTRKHWWMHSEIDSNLSLHQKSTALNFLLYLLCKRLPANYEKIRNSLTAQDHLIWFILVVRHKECLKLKVVINQTNWSYTPNSFTERTKEIWFCGFSLKTYCDCGKLLRWRKIHHVFTQEQILGYTYQLYVWKCFIQLHLL